MTKILKKVQLSTEQSTPKSADPTKGTQTNPYTQVEMATLQEEGTWNGGYVEGMGYIVPMMMGSDSSGSDANPYIQGTHEFLYSKIVPIAYPAAGFNANFTASGYLDINDYRLTVCVFLKAYNHALTYSGNVIIKKNGKNIQNIKLTIDPNQSYIAEPSDLYLGKCSCDLPQSGGVQIILGINANANTPTGNVGVSCDEKIYPYPLN